MVSADRQIARSETLQNIEVVYGQLDILGALTQTI